MIVESPDALLRRLERGHWFLKHRAKGDKPHKRFVYCDGPAIYWANREDRTGKVGCLKAVGELLVVPGLASAVLFGKARLRDRQNRLFSVVSSERSLDLEVGTEAERHLWVKVFNAFAQRHSPVELRQSKSAEESAKIWLGRKSAFGAMGQINDYMCLDGTIPVSSLPFVLKRIKELSDQFGLKVGNVFHAGDGNMHPLILFDANKPGDLELCEEFGAEILKLCVEVGGCLTGEHGVGIEKRDLMHVQYAPDDLEAQMAVKDVFDPAWLLNPAKVFPLDASETRRAVALAAE